MQTRIDSIQTQPDINSIAIPLYFNTLEETVACLRSIKLQGKQVLIYHSPTLEKPYYFVFSIKLIFKYRQSIRGYLPLITLPDTFVIKSLRADEKGFFRDFIGTITQGSRKPLRTTPKGLYTVTAKGIFKRKEKHKERDQSFAAKDIPEKTPQYTKTDKAGFSKAQPASLGTVDYQPNVFGFNVNQRNTILPAIILGKEDLLFTDRNCISDFGTVLRPYDFNNIDAAKNFYEEKVATINDKKMLYAHDEIKQFITAIKSPTNTYYYNEILVRMRWRASSTSLFAIAADTLECRLQTQEYSRLLVKSLQEQKKVDEDYAIPCVYYFPRNEKLKGLHLHQYTKTEMMLDRLEARLIYLNKEKRNQCYAEQSYHFLLALTADEIKSELQTKYLTNTLFWHVLSKGVQLMESLAELGEFSLAEAINDPLYSSEQFQNKALFHLARAGYEDPVVKYIIEYPGVISLEPVMPWDPSNNTPITLASLAVYNNQDVLLHALLLRRVSINIDNALCIIVVRNDNRQMFEILFDHIADNEAPIKLFLLNAAKFGKIEIIEFLVENTIELTYLDEALHVAARQGYSNIIEYLIQNGAGIHSQNEGQDTALCLAAQEGQYQAVKTLLEALANPNPPKNPGKSSPLLYATITGYFEIIKILIEYGACINACDNLKFSSLTHAVMQNHDLPTVTYLIEQGADVTEQDLNLATSHRKDKIIILLSKVLNNKPHLQGMKTKLENLQAIEVKSEEDIGRHKAIIKLKADVKYTSRIDYNEVSTLVKLVDIFIQLDKTCLSLLDSANQYTKIDAQAADSILKQIKLSYYHARVNPREMKNIHADLVKLAEAFHIAIKAKLKSLKPNEKPTSYFSISSLWKKEENLVREIQDNVLKLNMTF